MIVSEASHRTPARSPHELVAIPDQYIDYRGIQGTATVAPNHAPAEKADQYRTGRRGRSHNRPEWTERSAEHEQHVSTGVDGDGAKGLAPPRICFSCHGRGGCERNASQMLANGGQRRAGALWQPTTVPRRLAHGTGGGGGEAPSPHAMPRNRRSSRISRFSPESSGASLNAPSERRPCGEAPGPC